MPANSPPLHNVCFLKGATADSGFGSNLGQVGSVSNLSSATSLTNIAGELAGGATQQVLQQQMYTTPQQYQQVV